MSLVLVACDRSGLPADGSGPTADASALVDAGGPMNDLSGIHVSQCDSGGVIDAMPPLANPPSSGCVARLASSLGEIAELPCALTGYQLQSTAPSTQEGSFDGSLVLWEQRYEIGVYTLCDYPIGDGTAIFAYFPSGVYALQRDDSRYDSGLLHLAVSQTDGVVIHGALDAVLPYMPATNGMNAHPGATVLLHIDF